MFALVRHEAHSFFPDALTVEGRAAVSDLAKRLKNQGNWQKILTSPKRRTQETAKLLASQLGLPWTVEPALAERGDHEPWLPPYPNFDTILVTHAPVIREVLRAWCRHLHLQEPGNTPLGGGWIIDNEQRVIRAIHE